MEDDQWPFPTGIRFCPTDEELLVHYLPKKIKNLPLPCEFLIHNVRLYDYTPDQLAARYHDRGQKEWYFFTGREKKCIGGQRPNRVLTTGDGYWRATSVEHPVRDGGIVVGFRRSLVFYGGKKNKTNWLMQEYYIKNSQTGNAGKKNEMHLDVVLCKIYNRYHKRGGNIPAPLCHQSTAPAPAPALHNSDVSSDNTPESYFPQSPESTPLLQTLDFFSGTTPESFSPRSPASPPGQHSTYWSSDIPDRYCPQTPASAPIPAHHNIYCRNDSSCRQSPASSSVLPLAQAIPESSFPESPASVLPAAHQSMNCSNAIPKSECPQFPASVLSPAQTSMYRSGAIPESSFDESPAPILPAAQPSMYCSNAIKKNECPQSPAST